MAEKLRQDLPFSTDINAYTTTEPNHAETFNQRANQFASNDAYLRGEQDKIKQSIAEGLPANGGNADMVDNCHAGTGANNVLKLSASAKVVESALTNALKKWWLPSTSYAVGEIVEPLEFANHFIFVCTIAGQTSSIRPTWEAVDGKLIQDGAATWTAVNLRNALTVGGHAAGTAAGNVLVLDAAANVPLSVLSFIQNSKVAENFLIAATKRWWKASTSYAVGDVIQPLSTLQWQVYECIQAGTTGTTEPAWPSTNLSEFTDGTAKWKTRKLGFGDGVPIGGILAWSGGEDNIPNGYLIANHSYVAKLAMPQLFLAIGTRYGESSDGLQFRLPDYRGKFLRGLDMGRGLDPDSTREQGSDQGDAVRNVKSTFGGTYTSDTEPPFEVKETIGVTNAGGYYTLSNIDLDLSTVVPTAEENRPTNTAVIYLIKAFDATVNMGEADIQEFIQSLVNKVNYTDFIKSDTTTSTYDKLPSGRILQTVSNTAINGRNTFPYEFPNRCICVVITPTATNTTSAIVNNIFPDAIDKSGFTGYSGSGTGNYIAIGD